MCIKSVVLCFGIAFFLQIKDFIYTIEMKYFVYFFCPCKTCTDSANNFYSFFANDLTSNYDDKNNRYNQY